MNTTELTLLWCLRAAAGGQLGIAILNLRLIRLLGWEKELARVSLLVREVFYVHKWFISITVTLFAVLTLRFAGAMAGGEEMARWVAGGVACFWGIRTWMQWGYYSGEHWRGRPGRTAAHWILTGFSWDWARP